MKRDTAPRFSGIGGHHSAKPGTVEWLTPAPLIARLGPFDLDPCAPVVQPHPTAARTLTRRDNGLVQIWNGRIWLNPPYTHGQLARWLARMAAHNHGTALIFARTDTEAFHRHVFEAATALLFMRGRVDFIVGKAYTDKHGRRHEIGDIAPGNAGAPTVLCAYGMHDADVLAGCEIAGQFVPLRIPRSVLGAMIESETWSTVLREFMEPRAGEPIELAEIYRHVRQHPKAQGNNNVEAKARQVLQRDGYSRVTRGVWELPL